MISSYKSDNFMNLFIAKKTF